MTTLPVPPPGDRFNFAAHLFDANRGRGGRTAFIDDEGSLSFADLEQRARRFARALTDAGVRREERVLLLMHDTSDWPGAFRGSLYAGIVPRCRQTHCSPPTTTDNLGHCRARPCWFPRPFADTRRGTGEVKRMKYVT